MPADGKWNVMFLPHRAMSSAGKQLLSVRGRGKKEKQQ